MSRDGFLLITSASLSKTAFQRYLGGQAEETVLMCYPGFLSSYVCITLRGSCGVGHVHKTAELISDCGQTPWSCFRSFIELMVPSRDGNPVHRQTSHRLTRHE